MIISLLLALQITTSLFSQQKVVAVVNSEKITLNDVISRMLINNYSQTLEEILQEKILIEEAKKRNITVSDDEVNKVISGIKKRFASEDEFKKNLKTINITEKDYFSIIRDKLLADKAVYAVLELNDDKIRNFYDSNPEMFKESEMAKLRQIFVLTEQEANDVYVSLDAGADFIKLAAVKNADENLKKNAGDIGWVRKGMLLPDIEKEVFSTPKGKYTKPLKTGNGYSIIMVEDIKPERRIPFDDVKDSIISMIIRTNKKTVVENLKKSVKIEIK